MGLVVALIFPCLMVAAACNDMGTFKIPNRIVVTLMACWPVAALYVGLPVSVVVETLGVALIVLVLGFGLFAQGWVGAGDIKLLTAAVLWVGGANTFAFLIVMALAGAVLALALKAFRMMPLPTFTHGVAWVTNLHGRDRVMPYGVAIAAGALAVWPFTPFFLL